jgi:hypothetical protein
MSDATIEAVVDQDRSLRVAAAELASHGVRPGDHVKVLPMPRRRIRSMLGAHARPVGFTDEHLRELHSDMGQDIGGNLTK